MNEKDKLIEYYRKKDVTGTYDAQREGTKYRRDKRKVELKIFLDLIDKKASDEVLELGCSSGFLTAHLGKVTAIDTSDKMLEITHKKNPLSKCIAADMFALPFKEGSFNKVVTMRVWNHLDRKDLIRALKESRRVLKNRGFLIFDMEEKSFIRRTVNFFYKRLFNITGFKIYQYSLPEVKKILESEGFKIDKLVWQKHKVGRQFMLRAVVNK
jgi:ubiquinone/menaquinone biosynthesis C-methylase UbiE